MKTIKISILDLPSVRAIIGSFNSILQDERIPLEIREEYSQRFYKLKEQFEFDEEMDKKHE